MADRKHHPRPCHERAGGVVRGRVSDRPLTLKAPVTPPV
jgi:hypothetical protein